MPQNGRVGATPSLELNNLFRLQLHLPVCEPAERPTATLFPPKANQPLPLPPPPPQQKTAMHTIMTARCLTRFAGYSAPSRLTSYRVLVNLRSLENLGQRQSITDATNSYLQSLNGEVESKRYF